MSSSTDSAPASLMPSMKGDHTTRLNLSLGLLMAAVFSYRLASALLAPGLGLLELYLFGGILIAAALIFGGLKERRHAREQSPDQER